MLRRALVFTVLLWACKGSSDLRGRYEPATASGAAISIDDDCGGQPVWLDGKRVPAKTPIAVTAGAHVVGCGDTYSKANAMPVTAKAGHVYHFDYWGP